MIIDREKALLLHRRARGKIRIYPTVNIRNEEDLALAYIQGGVYAAEEIAKDRNALYDYTGKGNRLAVISDGTAVLGMGNIGPEAALPVMEGKCLLFKNFGDVNAIPICIDSKGPEDIVAAAKLLAPTFGAINIEDVSSPNSFTVVERLQTELDIPVFCDDQHGSAVVVMAAILNALKVVEKNLEEVSIVIMGTGSAGVAVARLLLHAGVRRIVALNRCGIIGQGNECMNFVQSELAEKINPEGRKGDLSAAMKDADIYIGLSSRGKITGEHIRSMKENGIVLALSMPEPEISADEALEAGAAIFAEGLAGSFNAMPNLHAYPGIARGLLDVRATGLNDNILMEAAKAIAGAVDRRRLSRKCIIPDLFSDEVTPRVAEAVAQQAMADGLARHPLPPRQVYDETWNRLFGVIQERA